MDWDIDVDGVEAVLKNTQSAALPFDGLTKAYGENLTNLMNGLDYDIFKVVASAIGEYSQHWAPKLEASALQVGASLTGAQNATIAYMNGQTEMAENAQRAAGAGEIPAPPGSRLWGAGRSKAV